MFLPINPSVLQKFSKIFFVNISTNIVKFFWVKTNKFLFEIWIINNILKFLKFDHFDRMERVRFKRQIATKKK